MKRALTTLALLAGLALTASSVFAWDYYYTGPDHGTGVASQLVKVNIDDYLPLTSGGSARAMGMGGAYTAIASDLGAVEYNPAGLAQIDKVNVAVLAIANRSTKIGPRGDKSSEWKLIPTNAGVALKAGSLALGLSRKIPQSKNTYTKFSRVKYGYEPGGVRAPDGYPMQYDTLSDKYDTSDLATYVLTAALKVGRLSIGANYNSIDGEIKREFSGRVTKPARNYWWYYYGGNDQFQATNTVGLKGYTLDIGALMDMGILRLGATAKNFKGSVDVTQRYNWKDNFAMGSGNFFCWAPPQIKNTLTKFAPTYTAGAALVLGKILTVDLDYVTMSLQDSTKAMGRLGGELAVVPGLLFARAGLNSDFKNIVQGQDQKAMKFFVGAGLKLVVLTVDASASLEQAKNGSAGDNMTGAVSAQLKF